MSLRRDALLPIGAIFAEPLFQRRSMQSLWKSLGFPDGEHTYGKVSTEKFGTGDVQLLEAALGDLTRMNQDFLSKAITRVQQRIEKELTSGPQ